VATKRILDPGRVRTPPGDGFSWVDRRFVRDHAPGLSSEAILLYFFLCAVSDRHGLSFWSDTATAQRLRVSGEAIRRARQELAAGGLVACEATLCQILSLPIPDDSGLPRGGDPLTIGGILTEVAARSRRPS
jgi:hypothetical protein